MSADNWGECPLCLISNAGSAQTLREDYELGTVPDGEFYVIYRCHCKVCGFKHEFKHSQQLVKKKAVKQSEFTYP